MPRKSWIGCEAARSKGPLHSCCYALRNGIKLVSRESQFRGILVYCVCIGSTKIRKIWQKAFLLWSVRRCGDRQQWCRYLFLCRFSARAFCWCEYYQAVKRGLLLRCRKKVRECGMISTWPTLYVRQSNKKKILILKWLFCIFNLNSMELMFSGWLPLEIILCRNFPKWINLNKEPL